MHSLSEFGSNVPAFLAKLWKLVDDPETNELICWSEEGASFYIRDQAQFSRKLLPMYYKHNNMASFIRQLNMYGFHKIVSADAGSLRLDKDEMEFAHQCFMRGHPYLLEHIKRKVGKSQLLTSKLIEEGQEGSNGGVMVKADFMNKILNEVKHMRGRQDTVESRLTSMKQENEALWRELSLLRQKHIEQKTIVNKLIQFLVTLVHPTQRFSKRRYPLMINSVAHPSDKSNGKVTNLNSNDQSRLSHFSFGASQNVSRSTTGPTIHELDGDVILPDSGPELLSNTITLHIPDNGFSEELDPSLQPGVMSPEPDVLASLDPSIIPDPLAHPTSSVPAMEVNSCETEALATESLPSPETIIAVPPSELNPAIIVPGLHTKAKPTSLIALQPQKVLTRSASSAGTSAPKSIVTQKNSGNVSKAVRTANKSSTVSYQGVSSKGMMTERGQAVKREPRVLPPRNRKKKKSNDKKSVYSPESEPLKNLMQPIDLLTEAGLPDLTSTDANLSSADPLGIGSANGTMGGPLTPPTPNHLVGFPMPESPIPIVNSPVASPHAPSPHYNVTQPLSMSPLSGTTITDITSPLVVYPPSNNTEATSPQTSPNEATSPYNMTLACTSQAGSSPSNKTFVKSSPFNSDDLDLHVGSMDSELGQLKELLNNSGIQFDANTLLGLFSGEDSSMSMPEGDRSIFNSKSDSSGNELMYYQPDFMDLEELWNNENNRSTPPPSPVDILSEINTPITMPTSPGFPGPALKKRRT